MKYAIAGVSGHTGKVAAQTLLAQGHQVRAIVRDAGKAPKGTEAAVADLSDVAALTKALQGGDGVYLLLPPRISEDVVEFQTEQGKRIVEAVKAAQPKHVVFLSSIGVQHTSGTGPIKLLNPVERALREATPNVTFIRAAQFMENLMFNDGAFVSFVPPTQPQDWVASRDIGALAASLLVEGPRGHQVVELGQEHRYSATEIARIKGAKLVEAPASSMADTLASFGFPRAMAGLYQEMTEGVINGRVAFDGQRRVKAPTTLERFFDI